MAKAFPDEFSLSTCSRSDEDSDEWDEMELCGDQITCLFCPLQFHTIAVALDHCRVEHNFDLLELKQKYNMDCYSYIKMINYIRLQRPDPHVILNASECLWDDECYMKPSDAESWLMYDFDDLGSAPSTPHYAIDGKTPINNVNFAELQRYINFLNMQLKEKDTVIENLQKNIDRMKEVTRRVVESEDSKQEDPSGDSEEYFNAYAHYSIHHEMLNDSVRTNSYRDAILNNSDLFKNKTVLDVGCGTGILSMFCAKAEAEKVFGVDESEVVYKAMDIIRENKLQDKIHLIKGQLEKISLPIEKVDIIISEWMGYFLLHEGMLNSVIFARNKFLKSDGLILPNRCSISLVGVSDIEKHKSHIGFWDNVSGFSMKCMKSVALREAIVETIPENKIITETVIVLDINLKTCTKEMLTFQKNFTLTPTKDSELTGIVGYFDTMFELPHKIEFSTGPHSPPTHWQQTVFYLEDVINVEKGHPLDCSISSAQLEDNPRGLSVILTIDDYHYEYKVE